MFINFFGHKNYSIYNSRNFSILLNRSEGKSEQEIMDARNRFMAKLDEYMKGNEPDGVLTDKEKEDIAFLAKDSLMLGIGATRFFK